MSKFKKYLAVAKISLQNNLAYKTNFIFSSLFYTFIIFVFLQLWRTIYGGGDGIISGFTLEQMIWYCIITEMIVISGSNIFGELNTDIKNGNIAYLLNKPYHYLSYQFSNSMGLISVKLLINAVTGMIMGVIYVGPLTGFHFPHLPFIILSVVLGIVINFFLQGLIGLTAFWLEENSAFYWIYQKLMMMLGVFLPIDFFPQWLQAIVRFLPFSFVTYGPARLVVDFSYQQWAQTFIGQTLYLLVVILLSFTVYAKGVKKLNVNGG